MINSIYPVQYCHFCNQLMVYTHYDNGTAYATCNSSPGSCMSFNYEKLNDGIKINSFSICDYDKVYMGVMDQENNVEVFKTTLILCSLGPVKEFKRFSNIIPAEPNVILSKEKSISLFKKVAKQLLLLNE